MAIYRRAVILGETGREGPAIDEAAKALLRRAAPPNHYSQSWIEIALGTALWAQGKPDQAQQLLNRGLLVGNQYDHPLTSWGLIVLGRIALDADQPAVAARFFEEATYTAADYGDARALEEAFRLVATASMVAGSRDVPAAVRGGIQWAKNQLPLLRAGLLGLQAEQLAALGEAQAAADALAEIDGRILRGDPGRGQVGQQQAYAVALVAYAKGNVDAGDRELERALEIARGRCFTLFRTQRLVESSLAGSSGVSDRQADLAFSRLLGDPSAHDVAVDPLGGLATLSTPRTEAFDAWLAAAARRGDDALLNAAETAVRGRWLATQPLGGRRSALSRLLSSDPAALPPTSAARRAGLLARHPGLPALLDGMVRDRAALTAAMLAAAGPAAAAQEPSPVPGDPAMWREYRQLTDRLAPIVATLAAGREAAPIDMPPLTPAAEIRRRLSPQQLILSFHWTSTGLRGALESRDRVRVWTVRQPAVIAKEIATLAKALSLHDSQAPVLTERLLESDWPAVAERLERLLFENSQIKLGEGIDELVIVPDGMLWYLPFELLPAGTARPAAGAAGDDQRRLRDVCRIRYCPTRSFAVLPAETSAGAGPVGVYTGRLMRGDKPAAAQDVAARLVGAVDRGVALPAVNTPAPVPLVASLLDTLVVVEELSAGEGGVANRPLVATQQGRQGMTFGDWLAPPGKRPHCIVLPGLQSAMAGGLTKPPAHPGEDLFLAVTSLMVAGGRTVLVSRWRPGGASSIDMVEEFLRDRGDAGPARDRHPAAESWQRAVDIVTVEQPDPTREPRIKQSANAVLPDARHPFFWAGYLLADCGSGQFPEAPPQPAAPAQAAPAQAAPAQPAPAAARPVIVPGGPAPPPRPAAGQPPPRRPVNPAAPNPPAAQP
jgi:tetratricopeptide (TPR) repeat protein